MYKLLIVDDEDIVRNSIATLIDWPSLGFSEVCQAQNGMEALELALKIKPDVILTDIRMPFMDGLELSAKIREQLPQTNIVILSGHDEFKYAQKAMEHGVIDYLLKPIGPDSLSDKMREIKIKLDLRKDEREYLEKSRSQLHQSLPLLTEKFLNSLIYNTYSIKTLPKMLDFLNIPLTKGSFFICVIEPDLHLVDDKDREVYFYAVQNITAETFDSKHTVFSDVSGRSIVIYHLTVHETTVESRESAIELLNLLKTNVNLYLKIQVTAAIGSIVNKIENLYLSYDEAIYALECKYTLGKNKIYDISDMSYVESAIIYPHDACVEFIDAVKTSNSDLIRQAADDIILAVKNEPTISVANIKLVFIEILTSLLKLIAITKGTPVTLWSEGLSMFNELDKLGTVEEFTEAIESFALKVSSELVSSRLKSSSNIISNVIEFINNNYQQEDISLLSVAKYASVNASYLSTLFKKETGKNFVDYLNRVRIEKAMDLLRTTDLKAYEIAGMTGFSNPHYFSILFKKHIGVSPSEFKGGSSG